MSKSFFDIWPINYYNMCVNSSGSIFRRDIISWALYDFANTIYSMNIISQYFSLWLIVDLGYSDIHYSVTHSFSMFLVAILMPALGYLSDRKSRRQLKLIYLFVFTAAAIVCIIVFSAIPAAAIVLVLVFFAFSNFFYEGGMVFYNALLSTVSIDQNVGKVSGFGVSLGYLGSIVGMILVLPFVTGTLFGINVPLIDGSGYAGAFLPTAFFFALFSIPIFLYVREQKVVGMTISDNNRTLKEENSTSQARGILDAYRNIWKSIRETEKHPGLLRFLVADYFFEDAIATVILYMAIFTERMFHMSDGDRTIFLIVATLFAMIGAYIFGLMADRFSPKKVLSAIVLSWIAVLISFVLNSNVVIFWITGPIVGILLGGVWAVSRPLLIELSPPEKLGEFFGLFSISGRAAAICGPLIWGVAIYLFSPEQFLGSFAIDLFGLDEEASLQFSCRVALFSLAVMMAVGLFIFRKVPDRKVSR